MMLLMQCMQPLASSFGLKFLHRFAVLQYMPKDVSEEKGNARFSYKSLLSRLTGFTSLGSDSRTKKETNSWCYTVTFVHTKTLGAKWESWQATTAVNSFHFWELIWKTLKNTERTHYSWTSKWRTRWCDFYFQVFGLPLTNCTALWKCMRWRAVSV